jgi:hypothetical protein
VEAICRRFGSPRGRKHPTFNIEHQQYYICGFMDELPPNKSRGCVKSAETQIVNDHIFDMANFGESSRWDGTVEK